MLKTSESTEAITQPRESVVGVDSNSRARRDRSKLDESEFDGSEIGNSEVDGGKVDDTIEKKDQKTSKFKNLFKFKKLSKSKKTLRSDFFTLGARLMFT